MYINPFNNCKLANYKKEYIIKIFKSQTILNQSTYKNKWFNRKFGLNKKNYFKILIDFHSFNLFYFVCKEFLEKKPKNLTICRNKFLFA